MGLSGGGCRAALLQATSARIGAAVIVGMMSTHAALRAAHRRLSERYERVGSPRSYVGQFHPGPHRFDARMQDSASGRLGEWLA